ncbi:MAG: SUMF1/EgtB/PvdO family nonheme iron enzyme [Deltaproteobacteria bacterium]|nr:SUMF1/EgtB/PvdO family nonheme iron enzyme [Deltaproteobacteria bacterium]
MVTMADAPKVEGSPKWQCQREGTVLIPDGFSQMGRNYTSGVEGTPVDPELQDQSPAHVVWIDRFCAQRFPITNKERKQVSLSFPVDQFELIRVCEEPSEEQKKYESCISGGKSKKAKGKCVEPAKKMTQVNTALAVGPLEVVSTGFLRDWAEKTKGPCSIVTRRIEDFTQSRSPKGFDADDQPAVNISYFEAEVFCHILGGRLPTEAEREKMARGENSELPIESEKKVYSLADYGAFIFATTTRRILTSREANYGTDVTTPVGRFPPTAWKLYDLAGLWEWTSDWYDGQQYQGATPMANPTGPAEPKVGVGKVIRGGGFRSALPKHLSATYRADRNPYVLSDDVGVRCVFAATQAVADKRKE